MDDDRALWSSNQNNLRSILLKPDYFNDAIDLCLQQHSMVHTSEMSGISAVTFEDELWDGLNEAVFRAKPSLKDDTISWDIWHTTRIEDITMNILVDEGVQVINMGDWLTRMNVKVCDTGNAMTHQEIIDFSSSIDMEELRNYRIAVGRKTREIIQGLQAGDLKRKMKPEGLRRILDEGAVSNVEGANWLIDFWGRKNVAGILLMPVTRHNMVHINDALRLKQKCKKYI